MKAIISASDELITNMGYLVDRMSVNLELPTIDGLKKLAPHKNPKKLVAPIRQIQKWNRGSSVDDREKMPLWNVLEVISI